MSSDSPRLDLDSFPAWEPTLVVYNWTILRTPAERGPPLGYIYPLGAEELDLDELTREEVLALCIRKSLNPLPTTKVTKWCCYSAFGCTRHYTAENLKRFFFTGKPLLNEETASVVLSFLGKEHALRLLPYLGAMISKRACLWSHNVIATDNSPVILPGSVQYAVARVKPHLLKIKIIGLGGAELADNDPMELLSLMNRIRKEGRPATRLPIPGWLSLALKLCYDDLPAAAENETICISKRNFRRLGLWLASDFVVMGMDAGGKFLNSGHKALGIVTVNPRDRNLDYGVVKPVLMTKDPLALAYCFCVLQRRLQNKILTTKNGQVHEVPQHRPYMPLSGVPRREDELTMSNVKKLRPDLRLSDVQQNKTEQMTSFEVALAQLAKERGNADWSAFRCLLPPPQCE